MINIRIAGVPEHFNIPWYLALETHKFTAQGIDLQWIDVPEGTGKMNKMLREGDVDMAVILTAGIAVDIDKGNPSRIIQGFVKSPLIWGIHTRPGFEWNSLQSIADGRIAISRKGSGSHFFPLMIADEIGIDHNLLNFVEVGTIHAAEQAFINNEADIFLWEKFMTEPLVNKGSMHFNGEWIPPWPAFVLVCNEQFAIHNQKHIKTLQAVINRTCRYWMRNRNAPNIVAERYKLDIEKANEWFQHTKWCTTHTIFKPEIENMLAKLYNADFITKPLTTNDVCVNFANIKDRPGTIY